ncbi:MAG: His/Gly/Thr/Pro-type tRNA ligase C-terminal domain-containing protein, partial [Spirochaetia bacterium]
KFAEWELAGVPVRVELGPRDMEKGQAVLVRRDTGEKISVPAHEVPDRLSSLLEEIQSSLFERARAFRDENTFELDDYEEMKAVLNGNGGFVIAPWDGDPASEAKVKEETKATIRVLPVGNEEKARGRSCIVSGNPARHMAVFSRAY